MPFCCAGPAIEKRSIAFRRSWMNSGEQEIARNSMQANKVYDFVVIVVVVIVDVVGVAFFPFVFHWGLVWTWMLKCEPKLNSDSPEDFEWKKTCSMLWQFSYWYCWLFFSCFTFLFFLSKKRINHSVYRHTHTHTHVRFPCTSFENIDYISCDVSDDVCRSHAHAVDADGFCGFARVRPFLPFRCCCAVSAGVLFHLITFSLVCLARDQFHKPHIINVNLMDICFPLSTHTHTHNTSPEIFP